MPNYTVLAGNLMTHNREPTAGAHGDLDLANLALLERLDIPFAVYSSNADLRYMSAAGRRVVSADAVWRQVGALICQLALSGELRSCARRAARFALHDNAFDLALLPSGADDASAAVLVPRLSRTDAAQDVAPGLTGREKEIGDLLTRGLTTKEVASTVGISVHTARHHIESVFRKLGVRNRTAAAQRLISERAS